MEFLYDIIEANKKLGLVNIEVPQFMIDNLSDKILLRDYQKEAIKNTLIYLQSNLSKNKQTHLLYHMATGSGKTVIMALNILYYYNLGYRNFLFFTNQTNIVSKTKINFLEKGSSKYLFSQNISINGNNIKIKEVDNFEDSEPNSINICFNTVQGIHSSLSIIKEGSLSIEDFEDEKIVLIADEAHHLNSTTAKDKEINQDNATWEDTVNRIFLANKDNVLLEFTATCDLQDANVKNKYIDKIVFNFDLREFRKAGYTKEFMNLSSNVDKWRRSLQAIIISEYRKLIFESNNISIKPVVLLKSKTITESNNFYDEFYLRLRDLSPAEIETIKTDNKDNQLFSNAFNFFDSINISTETLTDLIKVDFDKQYSVNMNSFNDENERIVNNLDEKDNMYRLIFIVDKLTEGWDVLSLFDIVRLYETRQGGAKGSVSKYTISEAQLIGRGARYCPFKFNDEQNPNKRKYSDYVTPLSICETLLYHCMDDSRYIAEIKKALKQTGLVAEDDPIKIEYRLKDSFKKSKNYLEGKVFLNKRVEVSRENVRSLPEKIRSLMITHECVGGSLQSQNLLEDKVPNTQAKLKQLDPIKLKDLNYNVLYKAYRKYNSTLSFDKLKSQLPNLLSVKEFLTSDSYLGTASITFVLRDEAKLESSDILAACSRIMSIVSDFVQKIEVSYQGTKEFYEKPIYEVFTNKIRNITRTKEDESWGEGVSQKDVLVDSTYRMDLTDIDWYAYEDNYGTSEEKKFVKYFSTIVNDLKKEFNNISLIRNELQLGIYSFDDGAKFEPDYVLILNKDIDRNSKNNLYICMFIEPKGQHLLQYDSWKNTFLLQLRERAVPVVKFIDDNEYTIWGSPLYNEAHTKEEFKKYFNNLIENC